MKTLKQYVVDAFTDTVFAGNPAAVCMIDAWLPESTMQKIAIENNLSETAFAVKEGERYHLRWFTPGGEVELCGHATLATAYVILRFIESDKNEVCFDTLSGPLYVTAKNGLLSMDFPSFDLRPVPVSEQMIKAVGIRPEEAYMGADLMLVYQNEEQIRKIVPDQEQIRQLDGVCLHITAPGETYDCVTRTFAPKCNVAEDPVCGRGHCHVIPYWAKKLNQTDLRAWQASLRGGELICRYEGKRTVLSGKAALYSEAVIYINEDQNHA